MGYKLAIISVLALHALTASGGLAPCVCTRNLQPVCGSDGETYSNYCLLECKKYQTGKEITVEKDGPCDGNLPRVCVCTYEYKPVCGTDGNTYSNRCQLLCERSTVPDIDVASEGACDTVKIAEPPCTCPDVVVEVCGSDGNTYENSCRLNCATAKNPSLRIESFTKCDDRIQVAEPVVPKQPPCICTEELNEVCGSDGTTYANPCLLNCATAKNPSLSVKSHGRCDGINVVNPIQGDDPSVCVCPRNKKPVCGTNGITYANECLLRCAGASLAKNVAC